LRSFADSTVRKGTGLIIPNLARLRRSVFIIDPKGEAAAITARRRARFGPVKIINPFNVLVDKLPYLRSGGLPLIRPEELMGMPAGQMLCFAEPVKYPFMTKAPGYWATWFGNGLDDNPYYRG
jgi:type IV secretory pathway TraG/TraD family ATPase VirD4